MKILICGDSFTADWSVLDKDLVGWCNWLANAHKVTNLAQAGVGEYKIMKQVLSVDLNQYDAIIISHGSPNRVYCTTHPIHEQSPLHKNADLIYADIKEHANSNSDAETGVRYYERYFDFEYYKDISNLCCMEILNHLGQYPHLSQFHIENFANLHKYDFLPESYNINQLLTKHYGSVCHLDDEGNRKLYGVISDWIHAIDHV
jgi:hypothetical protein